MLDIVNPTNLMSPDIEEAEILQTSKNSVQYVKCLNPFLQRESSWSLESEIDDEMSAISSEDMPNSPHSQGSGLHESDAHNMSEDNGNSEHVDQGIDDGYIFVFITKYVCDRESCGGTICPIVEGGFYECNRCGFHSSEEDFQKRLQQLQEE